MTTALKSNLVGTYFLVVLLEHKHASSLTTIHDWIRTTMSQLSSCDRDHVATELKYSSSDPDTGLDSGMYPLPYTPQAAASANMIKGKLRVQKTPKKLLEKNLHKR